MFEGESAMKGVTMSARTAAAPGFGRVLAGRGLLLAGLMLAAPMLATPTAAQGVTAYQDARTGAVMQVPLNKSQTLRVGRVFAKAVIGNDAIADVLPVSRTAIYVLGKAVGSTNLSLYDAKGGLIAVVDLVVGPDVQGLKAKLAEVMPTEAVGITLSNGTLVLSGTMSSGAAAERVVTIAETYAPGKIVNMMGIGAVQQVLLEVRFAEMSRGTVKELGINEISWSSGNGIDTGSTGGFASSPNRINNPFQFGLGVPGAGNLLIQFDALERQGLVRTLATPNLVALSGETASFLAGGEFPVPTGVTQNGQVSIEFKQFGVSLAFSPTVLEDGLINLVVGPEVSQLDDAASLILGGVRIPGLKVRRARTTVELRDGQSFALAGLIQSDFTDTVRAIPLLGRIPIIGALFRSSSYNKSESELVMIVTPRLVRPVPAGSLSVPTDRVLEPSDIDIFLNGKSENRLPAASGATLGSGLNGAQGVGPSGDIGHIVQ